jgi:hypothetical protein
MRCSTVTMESGESVGSRSNDSTKARKSSEINKGVQSLGLMRKVKGTASIRGDQVFRCSEIQGIWIRAMGAPTSPGFQTFICHLIVDGA